MQTKMLLQGMIFGLMLTIAGSVSAQKEAPTLSPTDQVRLAAKSRRVQAAEKIYDETKDPEAGAVLEQVLRNMITISPRGNGNMRLLEKKGKPPITYFLPVLEEDKKLEEQIIALALNENAAAVYEPVDRILAVNEIESYSEFYEGLIALHEGHHAYMSVDLQKLGDPQTFAEDERITHDFENRLVSIVGGFSYDHLLRTEVTRLRMEVRRWEQDNKSRMETGETYVPSMAPYNPALDRIFTPALSEHEKGTRVMHFWIHAYFKMCDEDYPKTEAEAKKIRFLRGVYQSEGLVLK